MTRQFTTPCREILLQGSVYSPHSRLVVVCFDRTFITLALGFWGTMAILFIILTQEPQKNISGDNSGLTHIGATAHVAQFEDDPGRSKYDQYRCSNRSSRPHHRNRLLQHTKSSANSLKHSRAEVLYWSHWSHDVLILGMGLPTTMNYIVVSSLMAPVIVSVGGQSGNRATGRCTPVCFLLRNPSRRYSTCWSGCLCRGCH